MQVVYAPGGIRLLPTASTTYKDCIYWIHGEIGGYKYLITRGVTGSGKPKPIVSEETYRSIVTANQEARKAIDLLTATRTKSKQPKSKSDRPE